MSGFKEYDDYDALGLAELVKKKDVSPGELFEESVSRIEQRNPQLNAVIRCMYDEARETLKGPIPDGPFQGVPFLLKDLISTYAGVPTTYGCKAYKNNIPQHDSELVRRFKNSGVVILGKTNTPEFGFLPITEPELFGPTRNPWNIDHTPGGSSGGSGAAVAAGIVPMASGGDGGGSIRIPSSCCGLFGLKPTRGRNPTGPEYGEIWQGAVVEHVLTRSVRDSAAMLDATLGVDIGAPYIIPPPEIPYLESMGKSPEELKIAFSTRSPVNSDVHPECIKAVKKTASLLQTMGHHVEEEEPDIDGNALVQSYFLMNMGEAAAEITKMEKYLGRKAKMSDMEIITWIAGILGRSFSAGDFVTALEEWNIATRSMGKFYTKHDLYLTPTLSHPPIKVGELTPGPVLKFLYKIGCSLKLGGLLKTFGIVEQFAMDAAIKNPFTLLANITGLPAMSVPLHWTKDGLPCGVQFIAPFGDETTLFQIAGQLEKAEPWFDKRPLLNETR